MSCTTPSRSIIRTGRASSAGTRRCRRKAGASFWSIASRPTRCSAPRTSRAPMPGTSSDGAMLSVLNGTSHERLRWGRATPVARHSSNYQRSRHFSAEGYSARSGAPQAMKERGDTMKGPEDDAGLAGKVAIVSGGGAVADGIGNGRAAAILLARAGTRVVVADLDHKLAERTVEMIKAEGGTAVSHTGDITKEAECKRLVDAAVDRWGRLDFLDNNVGIGSRGSVVDEKPDEYRRVMQVNVETMFLLSKHAIPAMIKTAKGGSIVNISSISALRPRGLTTYTTSKAAVIGLTQAMAVDHGKDHIRVNCICPGPMYTPMVYARGNGMSEAARAQRAKASVLKLEGTGWDIGHAVRFLMSAHARYITGQVLVVDGGVTLQGPERDSQDH